MTSEEKKLVMELATKAITKEDLLNRYPVNLQVDKDYILKTLENASEDKNEEDVEYALLLVGFIDFGMKYLDILCKILPEKWHFQHENIAALLQSLKAAKSVDCLYQTAISHYDYLDYDDSHALAVKCIWALGDIGDSYAKDKLKLLAESSNSIIRDAAIQQLKR